MLLSQRAEQRGGRVDPGVGSVASVGIDPSLGAGELRQGLSVGTKVEAAPRVDVGGEPGVPVDLLLLLLADALELAVHPEALALLVAVRAEVEDPGTVALAVLNGELTRTLLLTRAILSQVKLKNTRLPASPVTEQNMYRKVLEK